MDSLGDRIKSYEKASEYYLMPRSAVIIRIDGRAFHTFTRGCDKPFDQHLIDCMVNATELTAAEMMGFKLAYTQSDEATFLLTSFDNNDTQPWFNNSLNKIVSISASLFTMYFNLDYSVGAKATFDSRAFVVPFEDAPNVFVWRQQDWERNSLQMFARSFFSHKQLLNKNHNEMHEMLHGIGENWANLPAQHKNGTFISKNNELNDKLTYTDIYNLLRPE